MVWVIYWRSQHMVKYLVEWITSINTTLSLMRLWNVFQAKEANQSMLLMRLWNVFQTRGKPKYVIDKIMKCFSDKGANQSILLMRLWIFFFQTKEANQSISSRLKCAAGLADLATRKYKSAAKYFLQVNFDYCDFPEVSLL